jgi:hypothetical protein
MPEQPDREEYGDQVVDPEDQLSVEDTLDEENLDDVLDRGYSPPDRPPVGYDHNLDGESLDERLAQEEPDVDPYVEAEREDDPDDTGDEAQDRRSGRLVAPDEGSHEDEESDAVAEDVGIDGAGASAEEAAVHVIEEDEG